MKYIGLNRRQKHTERNKKGEAENVYLTSPEMTVRYAKLKYRQGGLKRRRACGMLLRRGEGVYLTALFMPTSLNTQDPPLHSYSPSPDVILVSLISYTFQVPDENLLR